MTEECSGDPTFMAMPREVDAECLSLLASCLKPWLQNIQQPSRIALGQINELHEILLRYPSTYEALSKRHPLLRFWDSELNGEMKGSVNLSLLLYQQWNIFFNGSKQQFPSRVNVFLEMKAFDQLGKHAKKITEWQMWTFLDTVSNWELKVRCPFLHQALLHIAGKMLFYILSGHSFLNADFTLEVALLESLVQEFETVLATYGNAEHLQDLMIHAPCLGDLWLLAIAEREIPERIKGFVNASDMAKGLSYVLDETEIATEGSSVESKEFKKFLHIMPAVRDNVLLCFITKCFGSSICPKIMSHFVETTQPPFSEIFMKWQVFLPWLTKELSRMAPCLFSLSTSHIPSDIYDLGIKAYREDNLPEALSFFRTYTYYVKNVGGYEEGLSVTDYKIKAQICGLLDPQQDYHLFFLAHLTSPSVDKIWRKWKKWQIKFNIQHDGQTRLTYLPTSKLSRAQKGTSAFPVE